MRIILFFWMLCTGMGLQAQYTQSDTLYLPPNTINEIVLGTIVEGDSILVAVMMNNQTEFGIRFRRIGYDGNIGSEFFFELPYFSAGPIYSKGFMASSDGGYYLGLYTAGEIQYFTGVLLKFTSDFQLDWQRNADHFQSEYNSGSWNVIHVTNDNNLLAVGQFEWHPNPGQDDGTHFGVALTKYTSAGDTLWSRVIDFGEPLYTITNIYELPNGELILTGYWDNVIISKSVIYKIGPNGEYWDRIIQGPNNLFGTTPVGFYHEGKFYAFFGAHQDPFGGSDLDFQLYLAILDIETMTWENQMVLDLDFESQPTYYSLFTDIVSLGDGRAVLAFTEASQSNAIPDPIMLLMVDTTGDVIWERSIPSPDISDFYIQTVPSFLDPSSDGGYTINGYFTNIEISQAHWYVKTDPCGQVLPYACDPNGVEEVETSHSVEVYPNPASNKIFLTAEEELRGVALYNRYGQLIVNQVYNQHKLQAEFDVSNLASGIYVVRVELESGVNVARKIIVE